MHAIHPGNPQEGMSFEQFKESFLEICSEHKKAGRAIAFAFILYDFDSPQYFKLLRDNDYWQALDSISGEYLSIFALNPHVSYKDISTSYESPADSSNELLEAYGLVSNKITYPAMLFFQVDETIENIVGTTLITMAKKTKEESYLEIEGYISAVVDVLKGISPENKEEHEQIFNLIKLKVEDRKLYGKLKAIASTVVPIASLIKLIHTLTSAT